MSARLLPLCLLLLLLSAACDRFDVSELEVGTQGEAADSTIVKTDSLPLGGGQRYSDPILTVRQAIALYQQNKEAGIADSSVWVVGYVVGYCPTTSLRKMIFGVPDQDDRTPTNIVLADEPHELRYNFCLPVSLPADDEGNGLFFRFDYNLRDNPHWLGKQLWFHGRLTKFYSVAGLTAIDDARDEYPTDFEQSQLDPSTTGQGPDTEASPATPGLDYSRVGVAEGR